MSNDNERSGMSGSDLKQSQSGGDSGEFGGNRAEKQDQPEGGGATQSDMSHAGGSSGTGGYGSSQDVVNHQGQQPGGQPGLGGGALRMGGGSSTGQSRGEKFDEAQGGGRGGDEISRDQSEHQDRGQSSIEFEEGRR